MGNFYLNSEKITNYSVDKVNEGGFNVLHISIETESDKHTYRVCSDTREPNLQQIENDFNSYLSAVINQNIDFHISEYLERDYIFVTFPNEDIKQYTAQRLAV